MAFLVVTRLRLRYAEYLDEFVASAFAVVDQANNAEEKPQRRRFGRCKSDVLDSDSLERS